MLAQPASIDGSICILLQIRNRSTKLDRFSARSPRRHSTAALGVTVLSCMIAQLQHSETLTRIPREFEDWTIRRFHVEIVDYTQRDRMDANQRKATDAHANESVRVNSNEEQNDEETKRTQHERRTNDQRSNATTIYSRSLRNMPLKRRAS